MNDRIIGDTEPLEHQFSLAGVPSVAPEPVIFIRRNVDGGVDTYFNGTIQVTGRTSIAMSIVDAVDAKGFVTFFLDTTGFTAGTYTVEIEDNGVGTSDNPAEPFSIRLIENTVIQNQIDIEAKIDIIDTNVDTSLTNQATIEGKIDTVDTVVDTIQASTDNLPSDPTSETVAASNALVIIGEINENEVKIDVIDSNVDVIKVKTDALPSLVASEANASSNTADIIAEIGTENDDAEAAAVGKAVYDPIASIQTIFKKDQPTVIHKQFNCKDINGNPALTNPIFQKVPI